MTSSMQKQADASHGGGCRNSLVTGHGKRQGAAEWNGLGRKQRKARLEPDFSIDKVRRAFPEIGQSQYASFADLLILSVSSDGKPCAFAIDSGFVSCLISQRRQFVLRIRMGVILSLPRPIAKFGRFVNQCSIVDLRRLLQDKYDRERIPHTCMYVGLCACQMSFDEMAHDVRLVFSTLFI